MKHKALIGNAMNARIAISTLAVLSAMSLLWPNNSHADIYRCDGPDGKVSYQATPCETGRQKALDETNRLRRESEARDDAERKEREAAEKAALSEQQSRDIKSLAHCVESKGCKGSYIRSLLIGMRYNKVQDVLGEPNSTQLFDGNRIWYYRLPMLEGNSVKRKSIQIGFKGNLVDSVNIY
ncbi:MAG: DUF4124 domain-containing protein [Burkholderiales bacterium]|nr:DUF4124 domain-containing protein [Burkholderiales bacterium]